MEPGADRADEVQVWLASADLDDAGLATVLDRLDGSAQARALRFVRHEDRVRSAVGRDLLNRRVGEALGVAPEQIGLERRCLVCGDDGHGKPRPTVDGDVVGLEVNLSHAAGLVALAVAPPGRPVGIDVEFRRDRVDWAALRRAVFSAAQWDDTAAQEDPERTRWQWWSRKEAVVKASGHGLAVSLAKVEIGAEEIGDGGEVEGARATAQRAADEDRQIWRRVTHPVDAGAPVVGHVFDLVVPEGYVGAVAALTVPVSVEMRALPHVRMRRDNQSSHHCGSLVHHPFGGLP